MARIEILDEAGEELDAIAAKLEAVRSSRMRLVSSRFGRP